MVKNNFHFLTGITINWPGINQKFIFLLTAIISNLTAIISN